MSIRIIKSGILDTFQDMGRYSYQHLGINPGGGMDVFVMQLVNALVDNDNNDAVIESHFPAATILFQQQALIAIGGADFQATINSEPVPLYHPVLLNKNCLLQFQRQTSGARVYISVREKFLIPKWLNSYSTNLRAMAGGFNGSSVKKDDVIEFEEQSNYDKQLAGKDFLVLPWKINTQWEDATDDIKVLRGNEWPLLNDEAKDTFQNHSFYISNTSDRMGYLLVGQTLEVTEMKELVSSAVNFGTIQLLPDGQMIILMADHQTAGGYPRIAHIIKAHHSKLAQMNAGNEIKFRLTDQATAEELLVAQHHYLIQMQNACKLKLASFLEGP
jgi:antagonist of KipI